MPGDTNIHLKLMVIHLKHVSFLVVFSCMDTRHGVGRELALTRSKILPNGLDKVIKGQGSEVVYKKGRIIILYYEI